LHDEAGATKWGGKPIHSLDDANPALKLYRENLLEISRHRLVEKRSTSLASMDSRSRRSMNR
jgi:hypothetical protein